MAERPKIVDLKERVAENVAQAFDRAVELDLQDVVIMGYDQDGWMVVRHSPMKQSQVAYLATSLMLSAHDV